MLAPFQKSYSTLYLFSSFIFHSLLLLFCQIIFFPSLHSRAIIYGIYSRKNVEITEIFMENRINFPMQWMLKQLYLPFSNGFPLFIFFLRPRFRLISFYLIRGRPKHTTKIHTDNSESEKYNRKPTQTRTANELFIKHCRFESGQFFCAFTFNAFLYTISDG